MKFSITIPSYKRRFLSNAIESVLNQTYGEFELIIVDDCSPEDLVSIVKKYKDSRIRYYRNTNNFGAERVVDNWNKCLNYSLGDYIICMGDDDVLMPCCLEEYSKLIDKYPNLNVYHAWTELIDENGRLYDIQASLPEWESGLSFLSNRWGGRSMFIGDFCYDVAHLRKNNGYYWLPMAMASDDITAVRAAMDGGIAHTQKICFQYRVSSLTLSAPGHKEDIKIRAILDEKKWYSNFIQETQTELLDEMDSLFFQNIKNKYLRHFELKLHVAIVADFKCNLSHLFRVLRSSNELGFTYSQIIKCWLSAFIKKIF